jgi:hypothetical protein
MNANKTILVWGHDMVGYVKTMVPHKYPNGLSTYN